MAGVGIGIRLRVLFKKLLKLLALLAVATAVYWAWLNRSWIVYHCQRQYDAERYNLNWKTDLVTAADKAGKEGKELLAVYLKKGDARSQNLIQTIAKKDFKLVENNYVLILVEYNVDEISPREKDHCEQMLKAYDIKGQYGTLVVIDPKDITKQREIRRVVYASESPLGLLNRVAGGLFVAREMVDSTPRRQAIFDKKLRKAVQDQVKTIRKSAAKKPAVSKAAAESDGAVEAEPAAKAPVKPAKPAKTSPVAE